ncbi:hypothetical protein KBZ18_09175 [Synechococcus sp. Cruz-9H2]|uniref:hypothetical protein n=1 Tax=unclassified Synechococcus TaxID=2626047 RepID=UPI0020CBA17F|nr:MULTISPECIES: hypothetical protein [unclassified Synechococcus]MCP9819663.1 hypothetical protein [Synechococcus sp. Cruz-9H2]MCP9843968.1 hypothetical protein [Synechococcus sp. Edmonson 11F2]MCP9856093.1 hypothetical protein [Synechococcus sp. Cruz-9C9]MCP9863377.1 hypothetical protein [Synechococcus sp. Cruz-7E5]MCP9870596.1 hypothetical protein [Synechococcus sp. Cruz-7B9]
MAAGRASKARALDLLGLEPGASALEVASGLGDDVVRMKARGVRAVGVDRSRTLIAEAQSRHTGSGCEFNLIDTGHQHDWLRTFQNPWIGLELSGLLADAGLVDIRQDAVWLPTHGFAESDLLFEIDANSRHLSAELPQALSWLEAYRRAGARPMRAF